MLKEKIKQLRKSGLTYDQISQKLNCNKSTVCYHIGYGQKQKTAIRRIKNRSQLHPYKRKIECFIQPSCRWKKTLKAKLETFHRKYKNMSEYQKPLFTADDVINKFGENPICYLTGEKIDIYSPKDYNFDHIIPRSRGGSNNIDNLGICTKKVNSAKGDMTPEEFIALCKSVLEHNGYKVTNE